jgi:hypothetical protein
VTSAIRHRRQAAFIEGGLLFTGIPAVPVRDFESLYEADREARAIAAEAVAALA